MPLSDFRPKLGGFLYSIMVFQIERMIENKRRVIPQKFYVFFFIITFFPGPLIWEDILQDLSV